jgi:hypothetical protein
MNSDTVLDKAETTETRTALPGQTKDNKVRFFAASLIVLTIVEMLTFLPIISKVGYYLDDWATLAFLHFAPHGDTLWGLLKDYFINDSRVLIRPVEVLHFGLIYWFCGESSYNYHLIYLFMEVVSAYLCYLIFNRLSGKPALALAASLYFLLHPGHDAGRYWVIAASLGLSTLFMQLSMYCAIKAYDARTFARIWLFNALAGLSYLTGLLNYESILPLAATPVMCLFVLAYKESAGTFVARSISGIKAALPTIVLSILSVVAFVGYQKVLMPYLGLGYAHAVTLDPALMVKTIATGIDINLPGPSMTFFGGQAKACLDEISRSEIWRLAFIALTSVVALVWFIRSGGAKSTDPALANRYLGPWSLIAIGCISVVATYSIFGLSLDYLPTYQTIVNRINVGASFALAFAFMGGLWLLTPEKLGALLKGQSARSLAIASGALTIVVTTATLSFFALANWGLAKPWLVSWLTQTQVRNKLVALKGQLAPDACVLLANCPRYVMWAPVYDGVWDFQNMARVMLGRDGAQGNVVSDRLQIDKDGLTDISYGFTCGKYPFSKLYVLIAPGEELVRVPDAQTFINLVDKKGRQFGLDDKVLATWREQAVKAR